MGEDSSWTVHCALFFLQCFSLFLPLSLLLSFFHSPPLSLSLEDPSATGASEAQERSLGKEEQRAVHLQPSPLRTSSAPSHPVLPSLGPLAHWPVPQIKTSDKKIGSLKKGEREKRGEKEGSPLQAKRSRATKPLLLDGRASLSLCEELSPCQLGPLVVRKTNYNEDTRTHNMHTQGGEKNVPLIDTFHTKKTFTVTCEALKAHSEPGKAPNREILKSL